MAQVKNISQLYMKRKIFIVQKDRGNKYCCVIPEKGLYYLDTAAPNPRKNNKISEKELKSTGVNTDVLDEERSTSGIN